MISIEYCHVYTNKEIDSLANDSITVLRGVIKDYPGEPYELVIMVDDYSHGEVNKFDYRAFDLYLKNRQAIPKVIINESDLLPVNLRVIDELPNGKIKRIYTDYIAKGKHPCSLFIASWYLVRLGYMHLHNTNISPGDRLINILPVSFIDAEQKASKILRQLDIPYYKAISNIYVNG